MLNKVTLWSRPGYRCGCAGGHDLRYFQVGERVCVSRRARALAPCLFCSRSPYDVVDDLSFTAQSYFFLFGKLLTFLLKSRCSVGIHFHRKLMQSFFLDGLIYAVSVSGAGRIIFKAVERLQFLTRAELLFFRFTVFLAV